MFTEIFGMAISTIMCCFIADEEMFPPQDRFADGDLKNALQKAQQSAVATKVIAVHSKVFYPSLHLIIVNDYYFVLDNIILFIID
jgi:hypothetical protein